MVMPQVTETPVAHGLVFVEVPKVAHIMLDDGTAAICGWVPPRGVVPQRASSVRCMDCTFLAGRRGFFSRPG